MARLLLTDTMLRKMKKRVELDAGYNNISLILGKDQDHSYSDGEIEVIIQRMARELLRFRKSRKQVVDKMLRMRTKQISQRVAKKSLPSR